MGVVGQLKVRHLTDLIVGGVYYFNTLEFKQKLGKGFVVKALFWLNQLGLNGQSILAFSLGHTMFGFFSNFVGHNLLTKLGLFTESGYIHYWLLVLCVSN